jgi:hypothetical protein
MGNHNKTASTLQAFTLVIIMLCSGACFKDLPTKNQLYNNDFEGLNKSHIKIYDAYGNQIDSLKIAEFNGSHVLGRFNNNRVDTRFDSLPAHNAIKIQFDLYIHDKWDGDYIRPGSGIPDVWKMTVDDYPFYVTTFSNGIYNQSFPDNYQQTISINPPRSNAWEVLPGVCSSLGQSNGSTHYKIELTTSHSNNSFVLSLSDALQPLNQLCLKSWSIDNLQITAIFYK